MTIYLNGKLCLSFLGCCYTDLRFGDFKMFDFLMGLFTFTGGLFWILAIAWFAGWAGDKFGLSKPL